MAVQLACSGAETKQHSAGGKSDRDSSGVIAARRAARWEGGGVSSAGRGAM